MDLKTMIMALSAILSTMRCLALRTDCVTGTFTAGSRGFITCLFEENLNTTDRKTSFNVMRFKDGDFSYIGKKKNILVLRPYLLATIDLRD